MNTNDILFVGHRGTGKTAIARILGLGALDVVDLDDEIEQATGESCDVLVAEDRARFRDLERRHLGRILGDRRSDAPRIVVLGAGCHPIPPEPLCVWLHRDGWEQAAEEERGRVRPDISIEAELEWMRETREPRWGKAAHLKFEIPHGRSLQRNAERLQKLLAWVIDLGSSEIARKSFLVPADADQIERAARDARRFGCAGVELRSDLVGDAPVPDGCGVLAALRTPEADWLRRFDSAASIDVDFRFLQEVHRAGVLSELEPRPLLLSLHPARVEPDDVTEMVAAIRDLQEEYPAWADRIVVKYAPQLDTWFDLGAALALMRPLQRAGLGVTCLPQGRDWAWVRPLLAASINRTNYLPVGLSAARRGWGDFPNAPPFDLQDWLPHLVAPAPQRFDALIGHPVQQSHGDVWHRDASLRDGDGAYGYLKIPVRPPDIDHALGQLQQLDIRGLSVTSPLKRTIVVSQMVAADDLGAANTLRNDGRFWTATDTDAVGMTAALREIESAGFGPGTAAIIGRGGVSQAIRKALEFSGWALVLHASAREGWPEDRPEHVDLVVNAAGNFNEPHHRAPDCDAWLDLHYDNVRPAPEGAMHFIGDAFFEAQAAAQRRFWSSDPQ